MAEIVVTQDELALRRRARRRLVGAVAIALTCIVVLPMLFDGEPKPLGPEVDIRIPEQNSPFEPAPAASAPAVQTDVPLAIEPEPKPAEATQAPSSGIDKPTQNSASSSKKPDEKPAVADSRATDKSQSRPDQKNKSDAKPVPKAPLKPDPTFSSQGYFLQLGAFTSEANARQLSEKAANAGFKAAMVGANGQFRVRVGPITQHQQALDMQARLKAKGFSPVLLGP